MGTVGMLEEAVACVIKARSNKGSVSKLEDKIENRDDILRPLKMVRSILLYVAFLSSVWLFSGMLSQAALFNLYKK